MKPTAQFAKYLKVANGYDNELVKYQVLSCVAGWPGWKLEIRGSRPVADDQKRHKLMIKMIWGFSGIFFFGVKPNEVKFFDQLRQRNERSTWLFVLIFVFSLLACKCLNRSGLWSTPPSSSSLSTSAAVTKAIKIIHSFELRLFFSLFTCFSLISFHSRLFDLHWNKHNMT